MLKQADSLTVQPLARIMPVLAVESIGNVAQELSHSATQFVKGQVYAAQVLVKLGETSYQVKIDTAGHAATANDGKQLKEVIIKMPLGTSAMAGQKLLLRYIHDSPQLTFLLTSNPSHTAGSATEISSAANLIAQYLQQAETEGASSRIKATDVVTHHPQNPQLMAHQLKETIGKSGLFYESHLADWLQGNQTLEAIKQAPQNQNGSSSASLMAQQLAVLEHQRIAWQGEVWPGQPMDWDIYQTPKDQDSPKGEVSEIEDKAIASELTLYLPHLGKVTAKISISDGRMRIHLAADQAHTLHTMSEQKQILLSAMTKYGQQLDAFTLSHTVE